MHGHIATPDLYARHAQEDRCAPRTLVSIPAALRLSGGRSFQTMVRDLSTAGFSAAAINRIAPGTVCWLKLPGIEALQSEVAWWDNSVVGAGFAQLLNAIVLADVIARAHGNRPFRAIG